MKHCPVCDERYDEEIIQFCTKDGSPLVDDEQPKFTALPSQSIEEREDDLGEATVIRRKPVGADGGSYGDQSQPERIIIPTTPASGPQIRPRTAAYIPPPPPNTAKTVVLTILGTLFILACGAGLFWLLQKEKPATNANTNLNGNFANQNTGLNTNLGFDGNFNFNTNANFNTNYNMGANLNANIKSPTPTPKPSPIVSPTPSSSPSPTPTARPVNANVRPSPTPTPRMGPRPPGNTNKPPGNGN